MWEPNGSRYDGIEMKIDRKSHACIVCTQIDCMGVDRSLQRNSATVIYSTQRHAYTLPLLQLQCSFASSVEPKIVRLRLMQNLHDVCHLDITFYAAVQNIATVILLRMFI